MLHIKSCAAIATGESCLLYRFKCHLHGNSFDIQLIYWIRPTTVCSAMFKLWSGSEGENKCSVRGGRGDLICSSPQACVGRFGAWLDTDCPAQIECFSVLLSPLQCLEISAMTCDDLSLMSLTQLMDFKWLSVCSRWWCDFGLHLSRKLYSCHNICIDCCSVEDLREFFFLFYFLSSNTGNSFSCVPEALTMNIFQWRIQTQGDYCSIFFEFFRLNRPTYLVVFHLLICVALNHIYSPKGLQHAHIKKKQWRQ